MDATPLYYYLQGRANFLYMDAHVEPRHIRDVSTATNCMIAFTSSDSKICGYTRTRGVPNTY